MPKFCRNVGSQSYYWVMVVATISFFLQGAEGEGDYDRALGQFMRNEIDYDEFMRLTGGQTLEEEMAGDGGGLHSNVALPSEPLLSPYSIRL